jgi:hypothetical protein
MEKKKLFKVGDKIRCVNAGGYIAITVDKIYIVIKTLGDSVFITNDGFRSPSVSSQWWYSSKYFELAEEHDNNKIDYMKLLDEI